ncbi:DUF4190 domain-containing protein [Cellulomonas sp. ACRRI]|uniref:DUF4190 domain-containing protein n=1 Tax=Cellulomonas sp. ACRRI TaxID=2918188 RepID=UPI001EF3CF46|nr:DUF4190 domain-containing protein [Cellulomonas sp. ACRRI]MCG7284382.1 DUF4190 domain-containing protein [Cellulomonas sp. ACRRI]
MSNDGSATPEPGQQPEQQPGSSAWPTPGSGTERPAAPAPSGYEASSASGPAPSGYEAPSWPTPPASGSDAPTAAYPTTPTAAYPTSSPYGAPGSDAPTAAHPTSSPYGAPGGDAPTAAYPTSSPYAAPGAGATGEQPGAAPYGAPSGPDGSYGTSYPQPGSSSPQPGAGYPGGGYPGGGYPGGGYPGGGYPQAPYSPNQYQAAPRTDGVSIAALVTGILGTGVVALVLGIIGLRRTKKNGTQGRGFAIAGVVLGGLGVLSWIVVGVLIGTAVVAHNNEMADLRSSCESGDMQACDDLFYAAPSGSDDEEFGDTCGGRTDGSTLCTSVDPTRWAYGDDAELDGLWDACAAGDLAACDSLYTSAPSGSEYEEFGSTCGGTTDGSTYCDAGPTDDGTDEGTDLGTGTSAQNYGDDPELDALWDACEAGSGAACDSLYWESEFGSAYEDFGSTCGNRVEYAASCESEIGG